MIRECCNCLHKNLNAGQVPCKLCEIVDYITGDTVDRSSWEPIIDEPANALGTQEGGSHYKDMKIQPIEYCHANNLGMCEGSVVKYISRWRDKNGIEDLKKAKHFIDLLIQLEEK